MKNRKKIIFAALLIASSYANALNLIVVTSKGQATESLNSVSYSPYPKPTLHFAGKKNVACSVQFDMKDRDEAWRLYQELKTLKKKSKSAVSCNNSNSRHAGRATVDPGSKNSSFRITHQY